MPNFYKVGIIQDNDYKYTTNYDGNSYKWMKAKCSSDKRYFKDGKYVKFKDIVDKIDDICSEEKHRIRIVVIIGSSICGALLFVFLCFIGWFYRCHIKHFYEKLMTVLYHHELFKKLVHIYSHIELNIKDGLERSLRPDIFLMEVLT